MVPAPHAEKTPVLFLMRKGRKQQLLHLERLARALQNSDSFSPLVACDDPQFLAVMGNGIQTIALSGGRLGIADFLTLRRIIRKHAHVIIHSFDMASAALAHRLAASCKNVTHAHSKGDASPLPAGRKGQPVREARVVTASSTTLGAILSAEGLDGGKIRIIPHGIALDHVSPRKARHDGRFIFTAMGDFTPENGHEILIRALPLLEANVNMPDWELRIIGEGELFEPLLELALSLGVMGRLAILGRQDPNDILPACDCLIAPAVNYAMDGEDNMRPLHLAWATGLPLIASNLLVHCEIARNRENALIYPLDDPSLLAASMVEIACNGTLGEALCAGGRATLEDCKEEQMLTIYMELYQSLLNAAPRP